MSRERIGVRDIDLRRDEIGSVFSLNTPDLRVLLVSSCVTALAFIVFTAVVKIPVGTSADGVILYERSVPVVAPFEGSITFVKNIDSYELKRKGELLALVTRSDSAGRGVASRKEEHSFMQRQLSEIERLLGQTKVQLIDHKKISESLITRVDEQTDAAQSALVMRQRILEIKTNNYESSQVLAKENMISGSDMASLDIDIIANQEAIYQAARDLSALAERRQSILLSMRTYALDTERQASLLRQSKAEIERNLALDKEARTAEIVMPFDGYVQDLNLLVGESVNAGKVLFYAIQKDAELVFRADIFSKDIGDVKIGDKALIEVLAYPTEQFGMIKGAIEAIPTLPRSPEIDESGVPEFVKYSVLVIPTSASLNQFTSESTLRSGMRFRVRIVNRHTSILMLFFKPIVRSLLQGKA